MDFLEEIPNFTTVEMFIITREFHTLIKSGLIANANSGRPSLWDQWI